MQLVNMYLYVDFLIDCLADDLGPVVNTDLNERCRMEGFSSSVEIPAGLACYNGTATLSRAEYFCNLPSQYTLVGNTARDCQTDGTWNGTEPQCLPQCMLLVLCNWIPLCLYLRWPVGVFPQM